MKVTVTGATGTIGRARGRGAARARRRGDRALPRRREGVVGVRRPGAGAGVEGAEGASAPPAEALAGQDGVIHLLGEPVAQRWSDDAKRRSATRACSPPATWWRRCEDAEPRPAVLVSQSASGCVRAARRRAGRRVGAGGRRLPRAGVRGLGGRGAEGRGAGHARGPHPHGRGAVRVRRRAGEDAAAVQGGRGRPGGGRRASTCRGSTPTTWSGALVFALDTEAAAGPVNLSAPEPVTNKELSKALGRVLKRPAVAPVPALRA